MFSCLKMVTRTGNIRLPFHDAALAYSFDLQLHPNGELAGLGGNLKASRVTIAASCTKKNTVE